MINDVIIPLTMPTFNEVIVNDAFGNIQRHYPFQDSDTVCKLFIRSSQRRQNKSLFFDIFADIGITYNSFLCKTSVGLKMRKYSSKKITNIPTELKLSIFFPPAIRTNMSSTETRYVCNKKQKKKGETHKLIYDCAILVCEKKTFWKKIRRSK